MSPFTEEIARQFHNAGIPFDLRDGDIIVSLPGEFGELCIGDLPGDDTIIGLVGHEWHTHGDLLQRPDHSSVEEAIVEFVLDVLEGKYHLVIHQREDGSVVKYLE